MIIYKITNYSSIVAASLDREVNYSNISAVCRGKRSTAGGYRWAYYKS